MTFGYSPLLHTKMALTLQCIFQLNLMPCYTKVWVCSQNINHNNKTANINVKNYRFIHTSTVTMTMKLNVENNKMQHIIFSHGNFVCHHFYLSRTHNLLTL